jgi:hypothetical protein
MGTELWMWEYLAQQAVMLALWGFLLSTVWREVRARRATGQNGKKRDT